MLVVIAVSTVLMGVAVSVLHMLMRAEHGGRRHVSRATTVARLADQFRSDVHAALRPMAAEGRGEEPVAVCPAGGAHGDVSRHCRAEIERRRADRRKARCGRSPMPCRPILGRNHRRTSRAGDGQPGHHAPDRPRRPAMRFASMRRWARTIGLPSLRRGVREMNAKTFGFAAKSPSAEPATSRTTISDRP